MQRKIKIKIKMDQKTKAGAGCHFRELFNTESWPESPSKKKASKGA